MTLHPTPSQIEALRHVASGGVVFHTGAFGPMQGYAWSSGGHMFDRELDALDALSRERLITATPNRPMSERMVRQARPVRLTDAGKELLAQFPTQRSAA